MPSATTRRSVSAVALTAAIAAALAGCGDQVASTSGKPPVLHLTDSAATRAMGVAEPATGSDSSLSGGYTLVGTLPSGQPDPQPVYRPRSATADDVDNIAAALGLTGDRVEITGGWIIRVADQRRLAVQADGWWTYGMDCFADQPVEKESLDVMCASATGGGVAVASDMTTAPTPADTPAPAPAPTPLPTPPPGPPIAEAEHVASTIFEQLGIGTDNVTSYVGSPTTSVTATPTLDGKRVSGWTTRLDIDVDDKVVSADGWLTRATAGDSYPVITAQSAFDQLRQVPLGRPEICMVRKDGKPGCEEPPPIEITGATLGLMLAHDAKGALLVPAWLFTVSGQSEPVTQIAIDPAYIAPPDAPSPQPADGSVNGTTPGQVPPAKPK